YLYLTSRDWREQVQQPVGSAVPPGCDALDLAPRSAGQRRRGATAAGGAYLGGWARPPASRCPISHSRQSGAGAQRPKGSPRPPQKVMRPTGCGSEAEGADQKGG